jgi:hypothetical protein
MNTNADVWRVGIEHLVPLGPVWLGPVGSFLSREDNGYNAVTLQFVPQKQRWAGGLLARVVATDSFTINLRGEHIRTREQDRLADPNGAQFSVLANAFIPGSGAVPEVSSNGWQAALGFNFEY